MFLSHSSESFVLLSTFNGDASARHAVIANSEFARKIKVTEKTINYNSIDYNLRHIHILRTYNFEIQFWIEEEKNKQLVDCGRFEDR